MKKIISIILVILWMILIFSMSSFNGISSNNQSGFIVNIISDILNINNIEKLSFIIRKLAHFTEYLMLGILVSNMIKQYNKKWYITIIICILYAISDEIHQILTPGRTFKIFDIVVDSIGSITGLILFNIKNIIYKIKGDY